MIKWNNAPFYFLLIYFAFYHIAYHLSSTYLRMIHSPDIYNTALLCLKAEQGCIIFIL